MNRVTRLWLAMTLIFLTACQPIVAPAPDATPETAQAGGNVEASADEYVDSQGRFSVPIPTNWRAEAADEYVILKSPDERIEVFVLAVPGEEVEEAVTAAWTTVDPTFDAPVLDVSEVPSTAGIERTVSVNYDTEEGSPVAAAVGMLANGNVYILLFRGDPAAFGQRAAQVAIIQTGLKITGLEETDLAGMAALPFDEAIRTEFESYIQGKLDQYGIPGAAVVVVQDGEIVYAQGFGVHEVGGDALVTPETLMMIGSTGKTITTMMMATIVDDGLMAWDTPVHEVLPQFAVADDELSETITMRNLVCACTGVPRRDFQLLFNANELSAEDIVESLQGFEFFTEFGEAFQYSNQLVATGGYAAAAAAGAAWGNLFDAYVTELQERVLEPIGMTSTTLSFEEVANSENYAMPHSIGIETPYEVMPLDDERFALPIAPAGGHWSTVLDMGRYLITELNKGVAPDGTRVVSQENLEETWVPQVPFTAQSSYGLGWFVDEYKGQPMLHHGGNTLGFTSDLALLPEVGVGIMVISNGRVTNYFNEAVRFRLWELLFEQPMQADAQADFGYETIRKSMTQGAEGVVAVDEAAVTPFLGTYHNDELGVLVLEVEEGVLYADVGEFRMEVRAQDDAGNEDDADDTEADSSSGDSAYVIYDAPLAGLPLYLERGEDDQPQVRTSDGIDEYIFTQAE